MSDNKIQVSFKDAEGVIFVIGADSGREFEQAAGFVLGEQGAKQLFARFQEVVHRSIEVGREADLKRDQINTLQDQVPSPQQAQQNVQQGLGAQPAGGYQTWGGQQQQQAPQNDPWSAPPQQQQQQQRGPVSETDKWGSRWTYGLDNAPQCRHGQMVKKEGKNKAEKDYAGWFCAAVAPAWRGQKPAQGQECAVQWTSSR